MNDAPEHTNRRRRMIRCTLLVVCCVTFVYHWNEAKYQNAMWKRSSHDNSTKIWYSVNSSAAAKASTHGRTKQSNGKGPIKNPTAAEIDRIPTSFFPWNISGTIPNTPWNNLQSIQTIYQYFLQHRIDAVVREVLSLTERQFAVAFLPCAKNPEAGAILEWHNFFNTLAWSIITNRTVIVQWYDPELSAEGVQTIYSYQRNFTCSDAVAANELRLASWFLQWNDIQQFDADLYQESIVSIPLDVQRQKYDSFHRVVAFPQIDSLRYQSSGKKADAFFHNEWNDHPLSGTNDIQYIKFMNETSRLVALNLFYEGSDFLYGAFFRICFPYFNVDNAIAPVATKKPPPEPADMSFALLTIDERWEGSTDDGSDDNNDDDGSNESIDISDEIKCLRRLLPLKTERTASPCQIVLLSNNPMIVDRLVDWIASSKRSCTVIRPTPTAKEQEEIEESDAFTSAIPLSDLKFASNHARTGIIGPPQHPSYQLLVEWMEFRRTMEASTGRRKIVSISTARDTIVPLLLWCDV